MYEIHSFLLLSIKNEPDYKTLSGYHIGICGVISILFMVLSPMIYNSFQYADLGIIEEFSWPLFILTSLIYGIPIFIFGLTGFIGFKIFSKINKNYNKKIFLVILLIFTVTTYVLSSMYFQIFPFDQPGVSSGDRLVELFVNNTFLAISLGGIIHHSKLKLFFSVKETAFLLNVYIATGTVLSLQAISFNELRMTEYIGTILLMAIPLGYFGYYVSRKIILKMKKHSSEKQSDLDDYESEYVKKLSDD